MQTPYKYVLKDGTTTWRVRYRLAGKQSSLTLYGKAAKANAADFCRVLDGVGPARALAYLNETNGTYKCPASRRDCRHRIGGATCPRDNPTPPKRWLAASAASPLGLARSTARLACSPPGTRAGRSYSTSTTVTSSAPSRLGKLNSHGSTCRRNRLQSSRAFGINGTQPVPERKLA